jgi:NAD-dependent SIR2 family protein deacetylase
VPLPPPDPELVARAAEMVASADALLVCAGAGFGVDSGLPDFRGDEGFWKAYPPYARLGVSFIDMANPQHFVDDPPLAWGFYGHRRNLYRATRPHAGFALLRAWCASRPAGGFVFTSNVDGQFQAAGFDPLRIVECHGTIHRDQCLTGCGAPPFPADPRAVEVDEASMRAQDPLPRCPACGGLARPNVLMFGDGGWDPSLEEEQAERLSAWLLELSRARRRLTVIECGAGTAIPTVRNLSERLAKGPGGSLVRINPREPQVPPGHVGIAAGARATLEAIAERVPGA